MWLTVIFRMRSCCTCACVFCLQLDKIRRQSETSNAASGKREKAHEKTKRSSPKGKTRESKSRSSKDSKYTQEARRDKAPKGERSEIEKRSSRRSSKHASYLRELVTSSV